MTTTTASTTPGRTPAPGCSPSQRAIGGTIAARAVADRVTVVGVLSFYSLAMGAGVGALWPPLKQTFASLSASLPAVFDPCTHGQAVERKDTDDGDSVSYGAGRDRASDCPLRGGTPWCGCPPRRGGSCGGGHWSALQVAATEGQDGHEERDRAQPGQDTKVRQVQAVAQRVAAQCVVPGAQLGPPAHPGQRQHCVAQVGRDRDPARGAGGDPRASGGCADRQGDRRERQSQE